MESGNFENNNNLIDELFFDSALAKTQDKHNLEPKAAKEFLKDLCSRNKTSRNNGETKYHLHNLNQTLNYFHLNSEAEAYRSLAGHYYANFKRSKKDPVDSNYQEALEEDVRKELEQDMYNTKKERNGDPEND